MHVSHRLPCSPSSEEPSHPAPPHVEEGVSSSEKVKDKWDDCFWILWLKISTPDAQENITISLYKDV